MDLICNPLSNIQEVFTLLYITSKFDIDNDKDAIIEIFNSTSNTKLTAIDLVPVLQKYLYLSQSNITEFQSLINNIDQNINKKFSKTIYPPTSNCVNCYADLKIVKTQLINTYTISGPNIYRYVTTQCDTINCKTLHYVDCYTKNSKGFYYNQETDYIQLSNHSVFERLLIENIDAQITRNGVSFSG